MMLQSAWNCDSCPNLSDQLEQMVGGECEVLEEETKEMSKQDAAQSSAFFMVLFCIDL